MLELEITVSFLLLVNGGSDIRPGLDLLLQWRVQHASCRRRSYATAYVVRSMIGHHSNS